MYSYGISTKTAWLNHAYPANIPQSLSTEKTPMPWTYRGQILTPGLVVVKADVYGRVVHWM